MSGKALVIRLHQSNNSIKSFLTFLSSYSGHVTLVKYKCMDFETIIDWRDFNSRHSSDRVRGRGLGSCILLYI